ncbi:DUF5658 family protein [Nitrosomonas supralitoralis]|uniref:DUF5658 domain-containing protein n=1 Tax=Nitrosomonas supralitoralis TaxID=2116706 RepID=A0A2P7NVA6_9PROT|nr:DUF5658 family protein [Nitrosomonas supralitoralis]PSJ17404.1 hypothetical protein C7H79_08405 [Nitrosomonas supralitoralis]
MSKVNSIPYARNQNRRQDMPFFCSYHLGIKTGRRIGERRITEKGKPEYVDRYSGHLMICTVAILLLGVLDAFFTLNILAEGGEELNWVMAQLIEDNTQKFVIFKLALTSMALMLLVIHHNVRLTEKIRVWHIKYMILSGYAILIGYELYLLNLAGFY